MVTPASVTKEDLVRFVDGRLAPERRMQVAAYLREHPETAQELQAHQRLNARLFERGKSIRQEPIAAALLHAAGGSLSAGADLRPAMFRRAAIIVGAVVLGAAAGWWGRSATIEPPPWQEFPKQAAAAYRVYAPERDRRVEIASTQELLARLSRRLGIPIGAPQLEPLGYRLIGGRLLPTPAGAPAAQLMYQDASGHRITVYIRADLRNSRDIEFQFARERDVNVLYWLDGPRGYALSADLDERTMLPIAKVLYDKFRH
jgi:anti-sigma factor RsiW